VKKKAALTLLRLYRKNPEAIPAEEWAPRIVAILDDENLGVTTAVTSLVMSLTQDFPEAYSIAYPKAVDRMAKLLIEEDFSEDYVYYKVPNPWLQVKLLRLLQYWPATEEPTIRMTLDNVLQTILKLAYTSPKNVQHNNAQNAVLFEAINLAIHLDPESSIVTKASSLLGRFILSRETNVRYLGLDTMAHLAACAESLEPIKIHQGTIILSLRDRDISVRRRGLDLLYSMCDVSNAKAIVGELLRYLSIADYALREELVLKIAILTEKFATEYSWYVDTILQLVSSAGDHVGEEVWFRVIQIVTNNEDVQEYAATKVFEHLQSASCHENLIKVGGYVLGEYGHLIANNPGASPIEQFHALHSRSHLCSQPTRALLLSTYVKWLNLFPEIREQIMYVLNRYTHVLDAELQQRACEYVALAKLPSDELLQVVCDEMPPFPEKSSLLLNRLQKKHGDTGDKRTWIIGGKEVNRNRDDVRMESLKKGQVNGGAMPTGGPAHTVIPSEHAPDLTTADANGTVNGANGGGSHSMDRQDSTDLLSGLEGLDLTSSGDTGMGPTAEAADGGNSADQALLGGGDSGARAGSTSPVVTRDSSSSAFIAPAMTGGGSSFGGPPQFTAGHEKSFHRICYSNEGVLFEDAQLQIGIKSEFHGNQGRIALYFGNKISVGFSSFSLQVRSQEPEALTCFMTKMPPSSLGAMTQVQQVLQLECKDFFTSPPILRIQYLAGSMQDLTLRLPVVVSKFIEPVQLGSVDFFERWKQIGGPPREAQKIFGNFKLTSSGSVDVSRNKKFISGMRLGVLEGIDPNASNIVAAGVLHMTSGKVGCLVRVEPNAQAKVSGKCRSRGRTSERANTDRTLPSSCALLCSYAERRSALPTTSSPQSCSSSSSLA
jgi:AP-2 complex subunit alpha